MSPQPLKIASDSAITSGSARLTLEDFYLPAQWQVAGGVADVRQHIRHYAAARAFIDPQHAGQVVLHSRESTRPSGLNSNLLVDTSVCIALFSTFKDETTYVFRGPDLPEFNRVTVSYLVVAEEPSRATWTIPTWTLLPEPQESVGSGLESLAESVDQIRRGAVPRRPDSLLQLARQTVDRLATRPAENVEEWANRLARDITDVNE